MDTTSSRWPRNKLRAARAVPADPPAAGSGPTPLPRTARRLAGTLKPQRGLVGAGIVALFAASAMEPLLPALFKWLLDHGFQPGMGLPLWMVPAGVIALFLLRGVLSFAGSYLFARATAQAVLGLRERLVGAVLQADASLYVAISPGVAAARVIHDPQNAIGALIGAGASLLRDGTTLLALLAYLFWLDWKLTLVSFVTVPALAVVVKTLQRRVVAVGARSYESQVRLIGIVDDIARAWRVVRSFGAGAFERGRFGAEARTLRDTTLKGATAGALMTPLTQVIASLGVALIVTLALVDAQRGGATVGEFVAFLTAMLMTISPMRRLTDITQPIVGGLIQARACFDLIDTPPEPDPGTRDIGRADGALRFERVTVHYPGAERPALRELTLDVPTGTTVALVGASGAGKTTLVSALLGFVSPAEGTVRLDGQDIGVLTRASLRRQFAVVSQDIVLFDGSIDDNVAYARPKDAARLEACLRDAGLWDFVAALPERGATAIGTNGGRLSGGQRQRLAIARALYKEAPVWIFDEATSALDTETERAVHEAIARGRARRTLILIAHRLSTVRRADCIHVLHDGRLVESGPHAALLARDGAYAAMVRAQAID